MCRFSERLIRNPAVFERFLLETLPDLQPDEAFVFVVLFRRKWAIFQAPDREAEIRERFTGKEVCLGRFVLCGTEPRKLWPYLVRKFLDRLPHYPRLSKKKGLSEPVEKLFAEFPEAISLLVTFEPRSLRKAFESFYRELNGHLFRLVGAEDRSFPDLWRFPAELQGIWKTCVHKARRERGREKFVLIDVDVSFPEEKIRAFLSESAVFLRGKGLDLRYASSTPCGGVHFVVGIDKRAEKVVFRKSTELQKALFELAILFKGRPQTEGASETAVEIKTGQVLVHVPGVNPEVFALL